MKTTIFRYLLLLNFLCFIAYSIEHGHRSSEVPGEGEILKSIRNSESFFSAMVCLKDMKDAYENSSRSPDHHLMIKEEALSISDKCTQVMLSFSRHKFSEQETKFSNINKVKENSLLRHSEYRNFFKSGSSSFGSVDHKISPAIDLTENIFVETFLGDVMALLFASLFVLALINPPETKAGGVLSSLKDIFRGPK